MLKRTADITVSFCDTNCSILLVLFSLAIFTDRQCLSNFKIRGKSETNDLERSLKVVQHAPKKSGLGINRRYTMKITHTHGKPSILFNYLA